MIINSEGLKNQGVGGSIPPTLTKNREITLM